MTVSMLRLKKAERLNYGSTYGNFYDNARLPGLLNRYLGSLEKLPFKNSLLYTNMPRLRFRNKIIYICVTPS